MPRLASESAIAELVDWIESRDGAGPAGIERRSEPRHPIGTAVELVPLDAKLSRAGAKRHAVLRDVSRSGIGLCTMDPLDVPFARVTLPLPSGGTGTVIFRVLRCERLAFLYNIGGRIIDPSEAKTLGDAAGRSDSW